MSLDDYNFLKLIGKGTYGEVHLVTHKKDKKQYVIKKLEFRKATAKERKSAEQEAKLLSNLRHPNIVSYKDSFQSDSGHLFIVMGFAEGGDLYTKLREQRDKKEPLGEVQTVRWYIQICMALQYLHERRILHRDLKTQNIFLTKTQIIKVGDLGIAKELESASDMATTLIGTPYYMSPELFSNRPYNHKSDVWALGCCMYEMVTLRHAFNAKDINSLMYKILKGKIPAMPVEYPSALCDLIREMLNQHPDKRPSVNKILRNQYIKKHIQLFLEESSKKKKTGTDKSRKSSTGSNGSHRSSARRTSANSQGSSPSPHPPSLAPDPSKPSRRRALSPIASPLMEQNPPKMIPIVQKDQEPKRYIVDRRQPMNGNPRNHVPKITVGTPPKKSPVIPPKNQGRMHRTPKIDDSGVYVSYDAPKVEKIEIYQNAPAISAPEVPSQIQAIQKNRETSASSSGSSSSRSSVSNSQHKSRRSLPDPTTSKEPTKTESPDLLKNSGESVVSVASSVTNSEFGTKKSARQRRRENKQKESMKTPAIVEEIRKSRSSGFKHGIRGKKNTKEPDDDHNCGDRIISSEKAKNDSIPDGPYSQGPTKLAESGSDDVRATESVSKRTRLKNEEEEFMTLLHTTLHLGSGKDSITGDSDSPISVEESDIPRSDLSPVLELTEGSTASSKQDHPAPRMTPAATPINVRAPSVNHVTAIQKRNVSANTLRSTQRLMDRIVALRKECIRALGVPLLHKAYEVLEGNQDDDALQEELITLLGPVRFEKWSGKIWQLKYCEESMFSHCGSITAY